LRIKAAGMKFLSVFLVFSYYDFLESCQEGLTADWIINGFILFTDGADRNQYGVLCRAAQGDELSER
jgi:hypothetical protein